MGKIIGMFFVLGGIMFLLYNWVLEQKSGNRKIGELVVFLQRSLFAMEEGKMQIIEYLKNYSSREKLLEETLCEIAKRLEQKIYPNGEGVWEQVFWEKRQEWNLDEETFEIVLGLGKGFFGKKRGENVSFLQRGMMRLEERQAKKREKDAKERKVWIPVSMLGGIMLMIILV